MSAPSSYKLQGSRTRPPPPPLRLQKSPFNPSSSGTDNQLLYDLPSASSLITPPPDQDGFPGLTSPAATPASGRARRLANSRDRATSPPAGGRARSVTPQPFRDDEVEQFAINCRSWYYEQDDAAGRLMTQTLASTSSSQRAQYARIQASVRSSYHTYLSARRRAEFQAHLSSTVPGGSLLPHSRAHPDGADAKRERRERLDQFIRSWCNVGMPGTKPFFEALWAVLRLQVVPESLGGAGSRRIEWEFDDAVFMESAGKEFMIQAVDILKGVLGFEEKPSSRPPPARLSDDALASHLHARSQSEPLGSGSGPQASMSTRFQRLSKPPLSRSSTHSGRARAPSDPFLDTNSPAALRPARSTSSFLLDADARDPGPADAQEDTADMAERSAPAGELLERALHHASLGLVRAHSEQGEHEYLRAWTAPDLANPELLALLALFPAALARRTLPRFALAPANARAKLSQDLEAGASDDGEEAARSEVRHGTGVMWVGPRERSGGWQGSLWERFKAWWRRLLC